MKQPVVAVTSAGRPHVAAAAPTRSPAAAAWLAFSRRKADLAAGPSRSNAKQWQMQRAAANTQAAASGAAGESSGPVDASAALQGAAGTLQEQEEEDWEVADEEASDEEEEEERSEEEGFEEEEEEEEAEEEAEEEEEELSEAELEEARRALQDFLQGMGAAGEIGRPEDMELPGGPHDSQCC
jgi:hypothetical protein